MAKYSFSNSNHWELAADIERIVTYTNPEETSYQRIPDFYSPALINANVIAIRAIAPKSPPYHRFAGLCSQALNTGIMDGSNTDAEANERKKIWLDRTTIIEWDNWASDYGLRFTVPYWIEKIQLLIFEYVGPVNPV